MNELSLLRLLHLTDPTLPIGGFAHSAGLETYVQRGLVHNLATATQFITGQLAYNLRYTDAALVSMANNAALEQDEAALMRLDATCHALKLPREIREASQKLGTRLLKVLAPAHPYPLVGFLQEKLAEKRCNGHYCIVFGLFGALWKLDKTALLSGFYYNAAVGMVTNCVKLVPLGQQEGQEMLWSLHPRINTLASETLHTDPNMLGMCCTGFDLRAMQHEQLYSRLYMS